MGTGKRGREWRPEDEHKYFGNGDRRVGTETRAAAAEKGTGTGTRTGSGKAEDRRRSARNRTKVVDATWETGETWFSGKIKNVDKESVDSVSTDPDNLGNRKEAGRNAQGTRGLSKNYTSRDIVSPLSRLIRGFRIKMTRMAGPNRAVKCNLINKHTHTHSHTHDFRNNASGIE